MFDPVDFDLFDPDTTSVRTLPWSTASASSPASSSYSNDDSSATLEREICTNFSCCGLVIPDMHDLLDHFEERHVLVSQDAFPASFPVVERNLAPLRGTPLVVSFPRPMTPPARRALPALTHSPSSASDSDASLVSPVDSFLPDSSPPMPSRALPPTSFSHDKRHSPSNATNRERGAGGRFKPRPSTSTVSAATAGGTRSALDLSVSRRRDRERQFRCPKPGCVKSYLNPNGLKYHLDKGTCKLIGEHSPA